MLKSCNDSGIASFTGDGVNPNVMIAATNMIKNKMEWEFLPLNLGILIL